MDSPMKALRKQAGLTQRELIARSGLTATAVVNAEAGLYEKIPLAAHVALSDALRSAGLDAGYFLRREWGVDKLTDAMRLWQRQRREQTGRREDLGHLSRRPLDYLMAMWPNLDRFAKDLCIPPSAIHQYRTGAVTRVPEIIRLALSEAGYRHELVTMDEWKSPSSPRPAA